MYPTTVPILLRQLYCYTSVYRCPSSLTKSNSLLLLISYVSIYPISFYILQKVTKNGYTHKSNAKAKYFKVALKHKQ